MKQSLLLKWLFGLLCLPVLPLVAQQANDNLVKSQAQTWTSGTVSILDETGNQQPLPHALVQMTDSKGNTYYAISDANGGYRIPFSDKDAVFTLNPRQYIYYIDTSITIATPWNGEHELVEFLVAPSEYCPFLNVDISAPYLLHCASSYYSVYYRNDGTSAATGAYVDVSLDANLTYDSTNWAGTVTPLGGNVYRVALGTVGIGETGSFRLYVSVPCNTPLGATYCTEAHIYPDEVCDSIWNGAILEVDAECLGDSIEFHIYNGGMPYGTCPYIVIEDDIMLRQSSFPIVSGQTQVIRQAVNAGSTYRFEVPQQNNFPSVLGDPVASVTIEGCGLTIGGSLQTGYVNQFSNGSSSPFLAVDCQSSVSSMPAYLKQAFPNGYGEQNYIYPYTELDYHVFFQSPTTSSVITITDTISPYLSLGSLEPGASSHPYTWSILSNNVICFYLDNSQLQSQEGFVKYRLSQKAGNQAGTQITAESSIRFGASQDYHTNQVLRTVGENFLQVYLASGSTSYTETVLGVNVYPNPFSENAVVQIEGNLPANAAFSLADINGRIISHRAITDQQVSLSKADFPAAGMYFYRIFADGVLLQTGKFIVK